MFTFDDTYYMRQALIEAQRAALADEVPIGAVITLGGQIIARGHNQTEMLQDVTAHAEMIALTAAMNHIGAKYLTDCTIFVTLEPCPMCAGALSWAKIGRVVWGADDHKGGFMRFGKEMLHPKSHMACGVAEHDCADILKQFFQKKRL